MATLYITEYKQIATAYPAPQVPAVAAQTVLITSTSTQSNPFNAATTFVEITCDADAFLAFGTNPVITGPATLIPADTTRYFGVPAGQNYKVAALSDLDLFITTLPLAGGAAIVATPSLTMAASAPILGGDTLVAVTEQWWHATSALLGGAIVVETAAQIMQTGGAAITQVSHNTCVANQILAASANLAGGATATGNGVA